MRLDNIDTIDDYWIKFEKINKYLYIYICFACELMAKIK